MEITQSIIQEAYRFVKNYAYHENLNLFLKHRVAEFETNHIGHLDEIFNAICCVISNELEDKRNTYFEEWLEEIDYHILPKGEGIIANQEQDNDSGRFFTNSRCSKSYSVSKVNYFISAPVELHIIEMLWSLVAGPIIDKELSKDCFGNRLSNQALCFHKKIFENSDHYQSGEIFKRYFNQYNTWRNKAIDCATEIAHQYDDVAILSLDLQNYFYNIDSIDSKFDHFLELISNQADEEKLSDDYALLAIELTNLLAEIFIKYHDVIAKHISITHSECKDKIGLPIGFSSSGILSNWHLNDFDQAVSELVRPAYYGRYVDDMLFVFKRPAFNHNTPITSFIEKYFSKQIIEKNDLYYLNSGNEKLPLQKEKIILHFFDKQHSIAGLKVFKKEIEERSSAFKFLPVDHIESEIDQYAYDIIYNGSINKFRSIDGVTENATELSRFLSSHIMAHRLCNLDNKTQTLPQIKLFFRGLNILRFSHLWEKVYQYCLVVKHYEFAFSFYQAIDKEIKKIASDNIKNDLTLYNDLSFSLCLGLTNQEEYNNQASFKKFLCKNAKNKNHPPPLSGNIWEHACYFREANLIRHHLVAWPLANFTEYNGDLTDENALRKISNIDIVERKRLLSPRFIHFDEWQIFYLKKAINDNDGDFSKWNPKAIDEYNKKYSMGKSPVTLSKDEEKSKVSDLTITTLTVGDRKRTKKIKVGIANIKLPKSDVISAVRSDKTPNISFARQTKLYRILNDAVRENIDLLVMPEVSIPVSWLPFMIAKARKSQIGLIFGLEHWVTKNTAYNLIIEALPFEISGKYKSCVMTARLKNHYAPAEKEMLDTFRLKKPKMTLSHYHKVNWKGTCFATYNCFELSNINHRAIFKSKLDLLIACVWNPDTNYYQHIMESVVRDIHCYVIQSNTAEYGGSCVLRPAKTESKTMLYVKGGENACVLTTELDIQGIRDFQFKSRKEPRDTFKPLPPGYDSEEILKR